MKIVCISDTHGQHRKFEIPEGDVLVFAGDLMTDGKNWPEIGDFNAWLGTLPHRHKVVITGNHDRLFESNPYFSRGLLTNCTYLENSGCEIDGVKFWGSPYTPTFCGWAFNSTPEELRRHWGLIPNDTDVLITHGPPYGISDVAVGGGEHLGCVDLLKKFLDFRANPKLHVFGHIHGSGGQSSFLNPNHGVRTRFVNASLVNEAYATVNKPIVVEL